MSNEADEPAALFQSDGEEDEEYEIYHNKASLISRISNTLTKVKRKFTSSASSDSLSSETKNHEHANKRQRTNSSSGCVKVRVRTSDPSHAVIRFRVSKHAGVDLKQCIMDDLRVRLVSLVSATNTTISSTTQDTASTTSEPPLIAALALPIELSIVATAPYDNQLDTIPPHIVLFQNLRSLTLTHHHWPISPATSSNSDYTPSAPSSHPLAVLAQFQRLTSLDLSHNNFTYIPSDAFVTLTSLRRLSITHNKLSQLPTASFRALTALEFLDISGNELTVLPHELARLSSLATLVAKGNRLVALHADIGKMASLTALYLSSNLLACPPCDSLYVTGGAGMAPALAASLPFQRLRRGSGGSEYAPESFLTAVAGLNRLAVVDISSNKLGPELSGQLCTALAQCGMQLSELRLARNGLSYIPREITALCGLMLLDLSHNQLAALPNGMATSMTHLHALLLHDNQLTSIGTLSPLAGWATCLQFLSLSRNQLKDLPDDFGDLAALERCECAWNSLKYLPGSISRLHSLTMLDCSHNPTLSALPSRMADDSSSLLTSLRTLSLHDTPIVSLPKDFSKMRALECISLANFMVSKQPHTHTVAMETNTKAAEWPPLIFHILDDCSAQRRSLQKPQPDIFRLVGFVRSASHPMLMFALAECAADLHNHTPLAAAGVVGELTHLLSDNAMLADQRCLYEAARGLAYLADSDDFMERMFQEGTIEVVLTALTRCNDENTILELLRCLTHLGFYDKVRQVVLCNPAMSNIIELLSHPYNDIQRKTRKLLAVYGLHHILYTYSPVAARRRGVRILSLDGGGVRGLVTIEMLKKIEEKTGQPIHRLFDFIAGTSTGALLAVSLGIGLYSPAKCQRVYEAMCGRVFSTGGNTATVSAVSAMVTDSGIDPGVAGTGEPVPGVSTLQQPPAGAAATMWSRLAGVANVIKTGSYYPVGPLESLLKEFYGESTRMIDSAESPETTHVCVVSTLVSHSPPIEYLFRNYNYRLGDGHVRSRYPGDCRTEVWKALRASTAAPAYFDEFSRAVPPSGSEGAPHLERFQDGGLTANNPTAVALHEVRRLWPDRPISVVVSLGTGAPPPAVAARKRTPAPLVAAGGTVASLMATLIEGATNPERVHHILQDTLAPEIMYHRFNPSHSAFACALDETNKEKLEAMQAAARAYIEEHHGLFERLSEALRENP